MNGRALRVAGVTSFVLAVASAGGCRGIVGIEELTVTAEDAGGDAADGSADASAEAASDADSGSSCVGAPDGCLKCCKDGNREANGRLEQLGRDNGCICNRPGQDGGACAIECEGNICGGQPGQGGQPPKECVDCVDRSLAECDAARTTCLADADCRAIVQCLSSCDR